MPEPSICSSLRSLREGAGADSSAAYLSTMSFLADFQDVDSGWWQPSGTDILLILGLVALVLTWLSLVTWKLWDVWRTRPH